MCKHSTPRKQEAAREVPRPGHDGPWLEEHGCAACYQAWGDTQALIAAYGRECEAGWDSPARLAEDPAVLAWLQRRGDQAWEAFVNPSPARGYGPW